MTLGLAVLEMMMNTAPIVLKKELEPIALFQLTSLLFRVLRHNKTLIRG
jgi:hypothetical protein